jgi:addiction module HigA family antidote
MNAIKAIRMKNPAHPGGFVKSEIVEALELSVTDDAKALGVTRSALSALLNERAALSSEMAFDVGDRLIADVTGRIMTVAQSG